MARFDTYQLHETGQIVLDCQSDLLDHFDTRLVVPLVVNLPVSRVDRLHPMLNVKGEKMIMATHLATAIPVSDMGIKIANLEDQHFTILDALDMLISGY